MLKMVRLGDISIPISVTLLYTNGHELMMEKACGSYERNSYMKATHTVVLSFTLANTYYPVYLFLAPWSLLLKLLPDIFMGGTYVGCKKSITRGGLSLSARA